MLKSCHVYESNFKDSRSVKLSLIKQGFVKHGRRWEYGKYLILQRTQTGNLWHFINTHASIQCQMKSCGPYRTADQLRSVITPEVPHKLSNSAHTAIATLNWPFIAHPSCRAGWRNPPFANRCWSKALLSLRAQNCFRRKACLLVLIKFQVNS